MACRAASLGALVPCQPRLAVISGKRAKPGIYTTSPVSLRALPLSNDANQPRHVISDGTDTRAGPTLGRRQVGMAALILGLLPAQCQEALASEEALKALADPILAYQLKYPVQTASGKPLSMTFSRRPEKYSSAAPLSPDARQRIVAEVIDLLKAVTASVTVGPVVGRLKNTSPEDWDAQEVAELVLVDRSTARVTSGQRVALNSIEAAAKEKRNGAPYFVYEHVSQGAPNLASGRLESYRHALAVTTTRPAMDGSLYLYTLNLACPDDIWDDLQPLFQESVDSFLLTEPTNAYVPPDKDPWLFF